MLMTPYGNNIFSKQNISFSKFHLQESFNFSETAKCLQERAPVLSVVSVTVWSICRDITLKITDVTEDKF